MKILVLKDLTKSQFSSKKYDARISLNKRSNTEYISQDECHRITNNLIKGMQVFIKGKQIIPTLSPYPVFEYQAVTLYSPKQLPKELQGIKGPEFKERVTEYNKEIVDKIDKYIKKRGTYTQNYDVRNEYFKDIMNTALDVHIKVYSPCARTEHEVKAYRNFKDLIPEDTDITDEQIAYVECNARKFGLEIPTTDYYLASKEVFQETYDDLGFRTYKSHGFTEEIYPVISTRPNFFENRFGVAFKKDMKSAFHPENQPEEWMVNSIGTTKGQYKEVYKQLKYIESLDPETRDFFIADGYCRCPHCGEITKKLNNHDVDIRCEYCDGILEELICVSNDHLLYGTDIDNSYSSLEDIAEYLNNQENDYEE